MKRVVVGGIPHWEDAGVRLPIIAGGDHIPGHVGTSGGADELTLGNFEGTRVTDANDPTFTGILRRTSGGGWVIDAGGVPRRKLRLSRGMGLVTAAGRFLSLGPAFAIAEDRLLSQSQLEAFFNPGGSGTSGPSFASTQAAQTQAEAFAREESARNRAAAEKLQRQREQNAIRQALIGEVSSLAQAAASIRRQSEADLMGLEQTALTIINERIGQDPVRGGILSSGLVQRGTTPNEAFIGRAENVAEQSRGRLGALEPIPTPRLGEGIAGLEQQRDALMALLNPEGTGELEASLRPPAIGLAHGGTFGEGGTGDALTVDGRTVARSGGVGYGVLVGEGKIDGDEEVLHFDESGQLQEIIPLAGGAAHGADFDFDASTLKQALSPAFESLGFSSVPTDQPGIGINITGDGRALTLEDFRTFGVNPRLVRDPSTGGTFFVNPEGTLQQIGSPREFSEFGFAWGDVVNLARSELEKLGPRGNTLTQAPPLIEPGVSERRFPQSTVPRTLEFPHGETILLPEMRKLASLWRFISTDTRKVISSALSFGGMSPAEQQRERLAFTPRGSALTAGTVFG